jgi:hypothetical protein
MELHNIPPGCFCVPAAVFAITGDDLQSVLIPAFNRLRDKKQANLHDTITGVRMSLAAAVLEERGYYVRKYKDGAASGALRAHVATWAKRSLKWPGRPLLIATREHCLVVQDGKVHDTWEPFGVVGELHPFAKTTVVFAALVEKA